MPTSVAAPRPATPTQRAIPTLVPSPSAPAQQTPTPRPPLQGNISITSPAAGEKVSNPVRISGTARVFEGTLEVAVKDSKGKTIGHSTTTASAGAPALGTFSISLAYDPPPTEQPGVIEVSSRSPRDGSVENLATLPIVLSVRR